VKELLSMSSDLSVFQKEFQQKEQTLKSVRWPA
jgi:hypothetical protein